AHAEETYAKLTLNELKQGIYQVLTLELPYLTPAYRDRVLALREQYRPTLSDQDEIAPELSRAASR
ncbi:MAG: TetR family transcriptional regulator, partial [Marinobacter alexandrii]